MVWSFMAAAIGMIVFGLLRPSSPDPAEDLKFEQSAFFMAKAHPTERWQGVIVGDSRALRGLSPSAMSEVLPEPRFTNMAFNAAGLNDEMYDVAERVLAPDGDRTVLVSVTALAFMPWKRANRQYHEYRAKPGDQVLFNRHAPAVASFFEPVSPTVLLRRALGLTPSVKIDETYHPDGWIETDHSPLQVAYGLEGTVERLVGNAVDPELIEEFMTRTRKWAAEGVRVFAVRTPCVPEMIAAEDSILGFDEADFVTRFEAAGGRWIAVDQDAYETYDASHLRAEEARRFSRDVAAAMAEALASR